MSQLQAANLTIAYICFRSPTPLLHAYRDAIKAVYCLSVGNAPVYGREQTRLVPINVLIAVCWGLKDAG